MKKRKFYLLAFVLLITLLFNDFANATSDSAITSPDKKTYSRHPGYEDTYFTYYSSLIGYKSHGLWGFYSPDGIINIPPIYSEVEALDYDYIKVKRGGYWGIIDVNGYLRVENLYDDIQFLKVGDNDLFVVKLYGNYGVVDSYGKQIVPIYYQYITKLDDTYLEIVKNYKHGVYAIYESREIISTRYDDIKILRQWFMFKQEKKWGLLDKNENIIIQAKYDDIKFLNNNYFAVKNNKCWGTTNINGQEIIPLKYDKIEVGKDQFLKMKLDGKWGVCTYKGDIVIPPEKGPLEINRVLKKLY